MTVDDDDLDFAQEEAAEVIPGPSGLVWKLLVVDDDEEVHEATRFALRNTIIHGRALLLLHASSAAAAATLLAQESEIAVVLLDVVMERHDAGLQLVRRIREELGLREVRIILRTGQPGYAPELKVIRDYDINDYKTKAELTHTRLVTSLIVAIRSFEQIRAINENRRGLELIVRAASGLMETHALSAFAEGVLTQIASLLHLPGEGIVCAQRGSPLDGSHPDALHVIAAAGHLACHIAQPLESLTEPGVAVAIMDCMARKEHIFGPRYTVLYLNGGRHEAAVFVSSDQALAPGDRQLVEVFAANVSSCFGNVKLVEHLNYVAYHDPLTGLNNRAGFLLELAAAGTYGAGKQVVCLMDIDRFTDINNGFGHEIGDQVLKAVAHRFALACDECRMARINADTFGLVGPEQQLQPDRLRALLQQPFAAGDQQLPIAATLGYCRIQGGEASDTLYMRADMALTQARLSPHVRHLYFSPDLETHTLWRLDVIRHLRRDFSAERLAVWYQPQISLGDGSVVGIEALIRWPGDTDFVHPPAVFIPLAEDSGLIVEIGEWVLDQTCAMFCRLRQLGFSLPRISVNVSMPQFRLPDFHERVARVLAVHHMPASCLELEITESILMEEPTVVLDNLRALKATGVHIAIDDFGTGYSSLGYLRQLPIDCLKIDRSFVLEIDAGKGEVFAETIVGMARKLGVVTVAEGVDTEAQVSRLKELGCATVQGFLYAKPMPAAELEKWMADRPMPA